MSNIIRISSQLIPINDTDYTGGGNTYQQQQIDKNAVRGFGGKYNSLPTYGDGAICRWSNAVVSQTSFSNALSGSAWTELSDVSDGVIPTTAYAIVFEYIKTLGTVVSVSFELTLTSDVAEMAMLTLGEGIVIPFRFGLIPSKMRMKASAYSNGVHEATVNVLLVGV